MIRPTVVIGSGEDFLYPVNFRMFFNSMSRG